LVSLFSTLLFTEQKFRSEDLFRLLLLQYSFCGG